MVTGAVCVVAWPPVVAGACCTEESLAVWVSGTAATLLPACGASMGAAERRMRGSMDSTTNASRAAMPSPEIWTSRGAGFLRWKSRENIRAGIWNLEAEDGPVEFFQLLRRFFLDLGYSPRKTMVISVTLKRHSSIKATRYYNGMKNNPVTRIKCHCSAMMFCYCARLPAAKRSLNATMAQ